MQKLRVAGAQGRGRIAEIGTAKNTLRCSPRRYDLQLHCGCCLPRGLLPENGSIASSIARHCRRARRSLPWCRAGGAAWNLCLTLSALAGGGDSACIGSIWSTSW